MPVGAFVDHANTLKVPGYALIGAHASFRLGERIELYADLRNLTDRKAITDVSAVIAATPMSAIYHPVEGRALFGGLKIGL